MTDAKKARCSDSKTDQKIARLEDELEYTQKLADYLLDLCGKLCENGFSQERRIYDLEELVIDLWIAGRFSKEKKEDLWGRIAHLQVRPWISGKKGQENGR